MKTIKHNNTTITYPDKFEDLTFQQYLDISIFLSKYQDKDLRMVILDLINYIVKLEGDIKEFDDLTLEIARPIIQTITEVIKESSDFQIVTNIKESKQVKETGAKVIVLKDRCFTFIKDISKMKMSKYIELELIINALASNEKNMVDAFKEIIGKTFYEVENNDEIIYIDTDETEVIDNIMNAPAPEVIKCLNFFLSTVTGSKKDLKKPSRVTSNTKRK